MVRVSATTSTKSKRSTLKIWVLGLVGLGVLVVALTFFWFVSPASESADTVGPADAVVVFVGGGDRLDTAEELVERGAAPAIVIPNGENGEVRSDLCDSDRIEAYCPDSETIDTKGEAQVIAAVADEQGWSSLIAVTSPYHVHRATYQLGQCFDGSITAVAARTDIDRDDWLEKVVHEWLGTIAAMTIDRAC